MEALVISIIIIYGCSLLFIFSYSLVQLNLVVHFLRNKISLRNENSTEPVLLSNPQVTVQLPVYNEMYVVERLIDEVSELNYPKDKLEIQILDDSNDETTDLIRRKVFDLRSQGFNINHIRRESRDGFKAGALAYGLDKAKGEFIAIFDSDFMPKKDFLLETLPQFNDPATGLVQTRWEHLNKSYSLITKLQAFGLDAHFTIEQAGRNAAGHFINFNGTAGIWRKKCIEDAGGWNADTLTEDLDLSYRAQLRGWKFVYLEKTGTPAELPVAMNALKNQQFRWNKGAAECVKKNLGSVLRKKELSWSTKLHAIFHLMNSTVFIFIMATAVLSIPMLFIKEHYIEFKEIFLYATFFLISLLILGVFYFTSMAQQEKVFPANLGRFLLIFPLFLAVSMGLSLHNAVAVVQGYFGRKTAFKRTPKFGMQSGQPTWKENRYLEKTINWMTVAEGILSVYFTAGIMIAFVLKDYGLLPFHILLAFGFGFVCYLSVIHSKPGTSSNALSKSKLGMARS
jgi:cellulose synthase/poly-beta-1,6-N-acetylglucosamine synthase-like glycosyltransferase